MPESVRPADTKVRTEVSINIITTIRATMLKAPTTWAQDRDMALPPMLVGAG